MNGIIPYIGYLILQLCVMVIGLSIIREKKYGITALLKSWVFGQMLLFAILQGIAVPMILLRWKFDVLFWTFLSIAVILIGVGAKRIKYIHFEKPQLTRLTLILIILTGLLILSQSAIYYFGIHLDEDDARWLAEANDAAEYGQMMTISFHTGEPLDWFAENRDVTSPWPMLFAILSRILFTRAAVVAHTIYPTVEIWLLYGIYYLIACELLEKKEARFAFLLLVAGIHLFYGGSVYTQGAFSLVRIWQGKATVAGVAIPFILYLFICLHKRNQVSGWFYVAMAGTAACLMSGMGIAISLLMIGVYGLYDILGYQRWKRFPLWIVSMLPSFAYALTYYCLKG